MKSPTYPRQQRRYRAPAPVFRPPINLAERLEPEHELSGAERSARAWKLIEAAKQQQSTKS